MLDDLQGHQSILEKRGARIEQDERTEVLETLNARWELVHRSTGKEEPEYVVAPVHNANALLGLCLRHLGRPATSQYAQDVLQDYYNDKYDLLLNRYDPYPAELILWGTVLLTARALGRAGERIHVEANAAATPDGPITVDVTRWDCRNCAAVTAPRAKCKHQTVTIEVSLTTNEAGGIVSTDQDVVDALVASASDVVAATLLPGCAGGHTADAFPTTALMRGGPERPKGHEWKLFAALFLMDLKRSCWNRGQRLRGQPRMVSLAGSGWTDDDAWECDVPSRQPSPEGAAVRAEDAAVQARIRRALLTCLKGLRPKFVAVIIGHYVLGLGLKDMVGLVPPKKSKESKKAKASEGTEIEVDREVEEAIRCLLGGVAPDLPQLGEEERDRRENVLRQWLFRARRQLKRCLASKGVSTVAGGY